ncbi:antirestriction protein ArdA [Martelella mangrovi]|uniref:Antirestriction protein n=1 Tax=Martelella mangrovi TaxID=1397477 RepID=A0ABV2IDW6_9HYPH
MKCDLTPRIYVACLASYNNGILHGAWIDASADVEEMQEEIAAMLKRSPMPEAEEWRIDDFEDLGHLPDLVSLEDVARQVEIIEAAENCGIDPMAAADALADMGGPDEDPEDWLGGHYAGAFERDAEMAEEMYFAAYGEESIPEHLRCHIDWEGVARDMLVGLSSYSGSDAMRHYFHA